MKKELTLCDVCEKQVSEKMYAVQVTEYLQGSDGGVILQKEVCSKKCLFKAVKLI